MIEHEGVIVKSSPTKATVKILNQSACASCQLGGKCNLSEVKEKLIDVNTSGILYNEGDRVTITGAESMGFKALFLGYILPFLIVLGTVVALTVLDYSEPVAGLVALSTLVPYYLIIKLMNHKLQKQFSFYLKNI